MVREKRRGLDARTKTENVLLVDDYGAEHVVVMNAFDDPVVNEKTLATEKAAHADREAKFEVYARSRGYDLEKLKVPA